MIELLISIFYTLRRWRPLVAWAFTAALIYPVIKFVPDTTVAFYSAVTIGIAGFAGGLYWEAVSGE